MKFIAIIDRSRKTSDKPETEELKRLKFEAPSITAAKTRATKLANKTVFLEDLTGKDLRWKNWDNRQPYVQDNGKKVGFSGKRSANFSGNYAEALGTSSTYFVWVMLYWEIQI